MANANLALTDELARAFADAQSTRIRYVAARITGESFTFAARGDATSDPLQDAQRLVEDATALAPHEAAFILFCMDTGAVARRWVLLAYVPERVSVRDRMLYSSSRESLKKQLGMNYFVGELHATDLSEVTWANLEAARKKQTADAPLSETERLLRETALLERDTNVRSTAMGVMPFNIAQNVRDKLALLKTGTFDWITMKLNTEDESVDVVKSLERVDLADVPSTVDSKSPSFVAYRFRSSLLPASASLLFLYVCPEDAPVRLKMVYSTAKATILAVTEQLGLEFASTIEINDPATAVDEIRAELAPPPSSADEPLTSTREFARPAAPGRGRGRGRGRGPPGRGASSITTATQ